MRCVEAPMTACRIKHGGCGCYQRSPDDRAGGFVGGLNPKLQSYVGQGTKKYCEHVFPVRYDDTCLHQTTTTLACFSFLLLRFGIKEWKKDQKKKKKSSFN